MKEKRKRIEGKKQEKERQSVPRQGQKAVMHTLCPCLPDNHTCQMTIFGDGYLLLKAVQEICFKERKDQSRSNQI